MAEWLKTNPEVGSQERQTYDFGRTGFTLQIYAHLKVKMIDQNNDIRLSYYGWHKWDYVKILNEGLSLCIKTCGEVPLHVEK